MSEAIAPAVEVDGVSKAYGGLRPFRMARLVVRRGERVALSGLDGAAAEIFTNLLTGATLPDEGTVTVLGQPTSAIADERAWLASLDRFGIVSARAVLLGGATVAQNLAMPFTLSIEPVPLAVASRVEGLAADVGLAAGALSGLAGAVPSEVRARVHLARAVALDPALLILEHPTAMVPAGDAPALAVDIVRLAESRSLTIVVVTEDAGFAAAVATRRLALDPANGRLKAAGVRWRWWERG